MELEVAERETHRVAVATVRGRGTYPWLQHAGGVGMEPAPTPSVLLGVLSASLSRRQLLRRSYGAQPQTAQLRLLFLVGRPANKSEISGFGAVPDIAAPDMLQLPVVEGMRTKRKRAVDGATTPMTGTVTSLLKLFHFLNFAAHQPERHIAKADDDTFVSIPALLAYTAAMPTRYYAGVFEAASTIPTRANIVAWGIAPGDGRARGVPYRQHNCTRDGSVPDVFGVAIEGDVCIGPFWFAKGPLKMIDRNATRALLADTSFFADYATIAKVPERHAKLSASASNHVSEDIFMGYWASQIPQLNIVPVAKPTGDQHVHIGPWRQMWDPKVPAFGGEVLALHKFPYGCHEAAASAVAAAWGDGASRRVRVRCPESRSACAVPHLPGRCVLPLLAHPGVERRLCAHAELETLPSANSTVWPIACASHFDAKGTEPARRAHTARRRDGRGGDHERIHRRPALDDGVGGAPPLRREARMRINRAAQ